MNFLFKSLLILLFLTTIGGASFQIIQKTVAEIQTQNNNQKITRLLESQIQDNKKSLDIFTAQNQRINSVLSIRKQDRTKEELKLLIKDDKIDLLLWVQLFFLVLLRFVIQLANLCCVWLIGWIYRNKLYPVTAAEKQKPQSISPLPQKISLLKKPSQTEENQLHSIREDIISLINTRNKGVSLHDVGHAIKESTETLEKIINPNFKLLTRNIPKLMNILNKLRNIYHQEKVSNY